MAKVTLKYPITITRLFTSHQLYENGGRRTHIATRNGTACGTRLDHLLCETCMPITINTPEELAHYVDCKRCQRTIVAEGGERWAEWYCPHPECRPGGYNRKMYHDPISRKRTVCKKGHKVLLVWRGDNEFNQFHARLDGRYRHKWQMLMVKDKYVIYFCPRCTDTKKHRWSPDRFAGRLPVFGCVAGTTLKWFQDGKK